MSAQPPAPPIAHRRGGAEPPAQPPAPPIAPRRGGAEPPAQPLHATNRTPSWGGGTPGGTPGATPGAPPVIACTRFNNKTWQEYQQWKNTYQETYEQIYQRPLKCIYGCPREISSKKIPPQAKILVIEMNNDENKIMGIGEIINQTASEVYRSPSGVVSIANAQSTPPAGTVLNTEHNPAHNRTKLPPLGGGTPGGHPPPSKPAHNRTKLPPLGGGYPHFAKSSATAITRDISTSETHATQREKNSNATIQKTRGISMNNSQI